MPLLHRIRRYAAQHSLWSSETRVMAAVSGGSDSVAMFLVLRELASAGDFVLVGLAHLHHHIRGAAADEDAAFCRELAARAGLPAASGDVDVPAAARHQNVSVEVAGRRARQRFFVEALAHVDASRMAVAHTRDDQAETVLMRLVRGAGATGLAGIAPHRDHLIRPLLETSRAELRAFLAERGASWREDATNDDCAIPRNLLRHEVLPRLRKLNPQADAALARTADILRTDAAYLDALANEAARRLVRTDEPRGRVIVDAAALARLPKALARRVALIAMETANPSRSYGLEEAQSVCDAAVGGVAAHLSGLDMERSAASVVLSNRRVPGKVRRERRAGQAGRDLFEFQLGVPGSVSAPDGIWTLTAEGPIPRHAAKAVGVGQVMVDAGAVGGAFIVRARRPGDRLHPLGAPGRKKVQDVFVDRKVPRDERDRVPIVTDEMGQIVWVAGQVLAEPFRVTPLTTTVVVLSLRRP